MLNRSALDFLHAVPPDELNQNIHRFLERGYAKKKWPSGLTTDLSNISNLPQAKESVRTAFCRHERHFV
ncbi:hypothetical protein PO124_32765 [Bacillus licheniformis]|nr:hypothetical protein [Bacillus licheniformis]